MCKLEQTCCHLRYKTRGARENISHKKNNDVGIANPEGPQYSYRYERPTSTICCESIGMAIKRRDETEFSVVIYYFGLLGDAYVELFGESEQL